MTGSSYCPPYGMWFCMVIRWASTGLSLVSIWWMTSLNADSSSMKRPPPRALYFISSLVMNFLKPKVLKTWVRAYIRGENGWIATAVWPWARK